MTPAPLVLASTSPYRRAQLERLGLVFRCEAPGVDERAAAPSGASPRQLAAALARAKAEAVAARLPDTTVIGGDQVCLHRGEVLGKPGSVEGAVAQLLRLQGDTHELVTALHVIGGGRVFTHEDVTALDMRPLDEAAARRYVAADRPTDCAGSYKLEERGIALFRAIRSQDQSAITGLPLIALCEVLRQLGHALP